MKVTEEDCKTCGLCCFFGLFAAGAEYKGIVTGDDGWCIYYDRELKCTIHDKKPEICQDFEIGCPECLAHRETGILTGEIKENENNDLDKYLPGIT